MNADNQLIPEHQNLTEDQVFLLKSALHQREKLALMGRITASVMHEINGPAEALSNLIYLIGKNADDAATVQSLVAQAEDQMERIRYVARQTLSYFRDIPQRQSADLVALVETAVRFHQAILLRKGIRVHRQMPASLVAPVYPGDVLQLMSNLLGNALEALPQGGAVTVRLRPCPNGLRLLLADNGSGIPDGVKARLFEPFQSSKAESGNGLGLWICKAIAQKHGGYILWRSRNSTPRQGTVFSVYLAA